MKNRISVFRTAAAVAVFLVSLLVFSGMFTVPSVFFKLQAAPVLMRDFAACSAAALLILAVLVVITLAAGRFYCSFFCPFGILQDLIVFLSRRKSAPVRDFVILRSLIAGIDREKLACCMNEADAVGMLKLENVDKILIMYDIFNGAALKTICDQLKALPEGEKK